MNPLAEELLYRKQSPIQSSNMECRLLKEGISRMVLPPSLLLEWHVQFRSHEMTRFELPAGIVSLTPSNAQAPVAV